MVSDAQTFTIMRTFRRGEEVGAEVQPRKVQISADSLSVCHLKRSAIPDGVFDHHFGRLMTFPWRISL